MSTLIGLMLRLPEDLHHALKDAATREARSLNGQIIFLLRKALSGMSDPLC